MSKVYVVGTMDTKDVKLRCAAEQVRNAGGCLLSWKHTPWIRRTPAPRNHSAAAS